MVRNKGHDVFSVVTRGWGQSWIAGNVVNLRLLCHSLVPWLFQKKKIKAHRFRCCTFCCFSLPNKSTSKAPKYKDDNCVLCFTRGLFLSLLAYFETELWEWYVSQANKWLAVLWIQDSAMNSSNFQILKRVFLSETKKTFLDIQK